MPSKRHAISVDVVMRTLAEAQDGVFERSQLLERGVPAWAIKERLRLGRIESVFRNVYAFSRRLLTWHGVCRAAALSVPGAVVSHRSAAALSQIRNYRPPVIDLTSTTACRRREGIRLHRLPIEPDEITHVDGIPVTSAARTILDLAATAHLHELRRAWREASHLRIWSGADIHTLIARYPGRTGIRRARDLAQDLPTTERTNSDLEERFLPLIAHLPEPEVNARVRVEKESFEIDYLWRGAKVGAELDTFATHGDQASFEEDRRRDRILKVAGFEILRITDTQLEEGVRALTALLASLS